MNIPKPVALIIGKRKLGTPNTMPTLREEIKIDLSLRLVICIDNIPVSLHTGFFTLRLMTPSL